ncbi:MAG: ribosome biogenesis GTPase Der [Syntrophobacteraceae bacterium]|jgi:GTP-binding protein|nr:ribosome biogenesis GTPase Der [Syntrophobacteraceae bacterium]
MLLVAIIGRPNVGKSTLFNRIAGRRRALVDDFPGVTRDRNETEVVWDEKRFLLADTAGYGVSGDAALEEGALEQIRFAIDEADILLFVADAKIGLHPEDHSLVQLVRRSAKPTFFAVNKIDGPEQARHMAEFFELGIDRIYPVSAAHGFGVGDLLTDLADAVPEDQSIPEEEDTGEIRMAIIGRPNVGKSTLLNRLLGEPRVIVSPVPGTTRDAVDCPFEQDGQRYRLIDTAGIRRKGRVREKIEKISIVKALESIERSHVCLILLDAVEGVTDQDLHIAGYVQERFRGCVVGINKWDAMDKDPKHIKNLKAEIRERFRFLPHAPILTFSALNGKRVNKILPEIREVFEQYNRRVTTGIVNRALEQTVQKHEPPMVAGRRLKFYYATQSSVRPPTFVLFCNRPDAIHFSYERYLTNQFREAFQLTKSPIRLVFRGRQRNQD